MRTLISTVVLGVIALGILLSLSARAFGARGAERSGRMDPQKVNFGRRYNARAPVETGAANAVASVVISYRGFDTLGEVTVLFIAAIAIPTILHFQKDSRPAAELEPASFIVSTGCRFLFPLILLFGTFVFLHGHLTGGGGFQGGAILASGCVLIYLGCRGKALSRRTLSISQSTAGLFFVLMGLVGLAVGGSFLFNFLPRGNLYKLFSAGVIPVIYIAIGFKVASELGGIIDELAGETK